MFANLLNLFTRRARPGEYDLEFVEEVRPQIPREPRSRRCERVLIVGWILIALKCAATWWVIDAYRVPVHAGWVIVPTLFAALVCTGLYLRRP